MYSLFDHGAMVGDRLRMNAYLRALEQAVTPNCCVVDIGAGCGIFSLMAAKLGARRVYAIEPDDIISLAHRLARDNGVADRITLIQADAREVILDEPADVIVSDIGGHLPWHGVHLPVINHARNHLLADGGVMIPALDRICAAVVSAENVPRRAVWHRSPQGIDLSVAAEPAADELRAHRFDPGKLMSDVVTVATLDYHAALETDINRQLEFDINRNGTACGVALWFDRELGEGIGIENGPGAATLQNTRRIYSHLLYAWPKDVDLVIGDSVRLSLTATLRGEDYDWAWDSLVRKIAGGTMQGIRFRQRCGTPPLNGANKLSANLSEEGKALRFCLSLMDSGATNDDIADAMMREFSHRFPSRGAALAHVAALCCEFS